MPTGWPSAIFGWPAVRVVPMSIEGLAEFRDRYESLVVTACEWRAMHADPEALAERVFGVLRDQRAAPDLRGAYQVIDKVVLNSYVEFGASRSLFDRLKGGQLPVPNAPKDTKQEAELRDSVSRLRRRDRELLQMAYWDELSESELAEVLGTDTDTVLAQRARALEHYRSLVQRHSPTSDPSEPSRLFRSVKPGLRTRWQ